MNTPPKTARSPLRPRGPVCAAKGTGATSAVTPRIRQAMGPRSAGIGIRHASRAAGPLVKGCTDEAKWSTHTPVQVPVVASARPRLRGVVHHYAFYASL